MDQSAIVEWLRAGRPWGKAPKVEETHAAYVFLVGELAFKLKKAGQPRLPRRRKSAAKSSNAN